MGTQGWGKDTPRHRSLTHKDREPHETRVTRKGWQKETQSAKCYQNSFYPFIHQSLQYESGLTLSVSTLVRIMHSDIMTHYNFTGGFGVCRAPAKQTKGQPGAGNKDFAHGS